MKREIPRKSLFFFEKYFSSIDVHQAENKTEIPSQLHLLVRARNYGQAYGHVLGKNEKK